MRTEADIHMCIPGPANCRHKGTALAPSCLSPKGSSGRHPSKIKVPLERKNWVPCTQNCSPPRDFKFAKNRLGVNSPAEKFFGGCGRERERIIKNKNKHGKEKFR